MKTFRILSLLALLIAMRTPAVQAQDYVVTARRDTLRGTVKPLPFGTEKKVQVTTADKKKQILSVTQTLGYFLDGETFQSVRYDKGYTFMKLVKSGYLSLYQFQLPNQTTYDGQFLVKRDGTYMEVPNIGFKKNMLKFLEDCPTVVNGIESGEYSKRDLDKIVDAYNGCVSSRTSESSKVIAVNIEAAKKITTWDSLEKSIQNETDFDGKKDALDMITDIKGKFARNEKIPNFLVEGLKNILAAKPALKTELEEIIAKTNQ